MKATALLGFWAATASLGVAAQGMDFGSGFGATPPGIGGPSLPPFLTNGLGATTLNGGVPGLGGIGSIGGGGFGGGGFGGFGSGGIGVGPGIGTGTGIGMGSDSTAGIGFGATPSIGIGSLPPGGLHADLFGRLPNLTGSGMMLGSGSSSGLLDFLTTPTLEDPFLSLPPTTQRSPTLGGSSPGATSAGGTFLDNPFCRPEDFTC